MAATYDPELRILITGFGRYRGFNINPSWQIVSSLPSTLTHRGITIRLITTPESLKSEYHYLINTIPRILDDVKPHAFICVGQDELAKDFMIERGARRDVYFECPDMARKALTKAETKAIWKVGPESIETKMGIESVLTSWKRLITASAPPKTKIPGAGISADAGNYVCGLAYYATLEHLRAYENETMQATFLHVPPLESDDELKQGRDVTIALIKAVAESCEY